MWAKSIFVVVLLISGVLLQEWSWPRSFPKWQCSLTLSIDWDMALLWFDCCGLSLLWEIIQFKKFCYLSNFLLKLMVTASVFLPKFISRFFPFVSGALETKASYKGKVREATPQRGCEKEERVWIWGCFPFHWNSFPVCYNVSVVRMKSTS